MSIMGKGYDWVGGGYHRMCRFCHKQGKSTRLLHYGTRAYAHTACLIKAKGEEFVLALPPGTLANAAVMAFSKPNQRRLMERVTGEPWPSPQRDPKEVE